jgi:hypothetical protein
MEMNKPEHPEGVEGSEPIVYPTPEEISEVRKAMEELSRLFKLLDEENF